MKKILVAAVMLAAVSANGFAYNFFAGGTFALFGGSEGHAIENEGGNVLTGGSGFGISPYIGYLLNEKSDVSIAITYNNASYTVNDAYEETATEIGVTLGYEYNIAAFGPLSVYIAPTLSYSQTSLKEGDFDESTIGISVAPNVQYALSDRIGLIATLNFLSLNWSSTEGNTSFIFGADTNNAASSADFTIGFFVNF
ncbi:MAG: hypothetical protein LBO62_03975 [Endomicrobium sp.]|nr:hypothetical protein [Endomicrobium sp.]